MNAASENLLPYHPALERIRRFRLLYAIAVNSVAILLVVAIILSWRVTEYRTLGQLTVSVPADSPIPPAEAAEHLTRCIRETASDESLAKVLSRSLLPSRTSAAEAPENQATEWTPQQLDQVRQAMAFSVTPARSKAGMQVTIVVAGKGSPRETALVRSFLEQLNQTLVDEVSSQATRDVAEVLKPERLQDLRDRQDAQLVAVNDHLQSMNTELVSLATDTMELASTVGSMSVGNVAPGLQAGQSAPTAGLSGTDPANGQKLANPFQPAGFQSQKTGASDHSHLPTANDLRERFGKLPVHELSRSIVKVEQDWNATLAPMEELLARASVSTTSTALRPVARSEMRQVPHGLQIPREWLLLAVASALALGCVLASGVDMRSHDPGLGSTDQVEKVLGVPVIGNLRSPSAPGQAFRNTWSVRILKLNELVVFTTLLTLIVVCLSAPEIRQNLIENPLHAVARILWSIRSLA